MIRTISRRHFLISAGAMALAGPVLAACTQAAQPTATSAPKPSGGAQATTAPKPGATAPATGATPMATQAAASKPAGGAKTTLTVGIRASADGAGNWQRAGIKQYAQNHPEVTIQPVEVAYEDMAKKQLAMLATDTMPDVVFSGIKWFHYSAFKGAFHALDDFVKTTDPGMDDFFKAAVEGCRQDGKLYGLPIELNTGNQNIVVFNKDLLAAKGVKEPTDDWTLEEYAATAAKLTDSGKRIFGTNFMTGTYYDFSALARTFGGDVLSSDGKQFTLATDPKAVEAAKWHVELRTKQKAAPVRAEAQDLGFPAGQIAFLATGIYNVVPQKQTVGDKFKWDVVLGPKGPTGLRGYEAFIGMHSMYAKTKVPQVAYDYITFTVSKEMAKLSVVEYGYSSARISAWSSPELQKISTIFGRAATWMADGKNQGPFPMPANLRFSELQDKWANLSTPLFYGEVGFDEGLKKLQDECAAIMAQPPG